MSRVNSEAICWFGPNPIGGAILVSDDGTEVTSLIVGIVELGDAKLPGISNTSAPDCPPQPLKMTATTHLIFNDIIFA